MGKLIGALVGSILLLVLFIFIGPFVTQWAWSHSLTPVFGIREISWVEAFAFQLLSTMLVKNSSMKISRKDDTH